jgi:hypothetical protein
MYYVLTYKKRRPTLKKLNFYTFIYKLFKKDAHAATPAKTVAPHSITARKTHA